MFMCLTLSKKFGCRLPDFEQEFNRYLTWCRTTSSSVLYRSFWSGSVRYRSWRISDWVPFYEKITPGQKNICLLVVQNFRCPECGKMCKSYAGLRSHVKGHRGQEAHLGTGLVGTVPRLALQSSQVGHFSEFAHLWSKQKFRQGYAQSLGYFWFPFL
jgi:hypothetical protein